VLSVLLRYTDSDCPFGIFKLLLLLFAELLDLSCGFFGDQNEFIIYIFTPINPMYSNGIEIFMGIKTTAVYKMIKTYKKQKLLTLSRAPRFNPPFCGICVVNVLVF
jgi:hypothetical protein